MKSDALLSSVRDRLLAEAERSPGLLEDLAGLESYISESYHCRSLIELLQNADDAGSGSFSVYRDNGMVVVANDGREFTEADLESLCRSAHSAKDGGKTIGFRGIGFKSIVSFSSRVFVLSGELRACFAKELTQVALSANGKVPLVRIPHPIPAKDLPVVTAIFDRAEQKGFRTVFAFACSSEQPLLDEVEEFVTSAVLFLKNLKKVRIALGRDINIVINRFTQEGKNDIILQYDDQFFKWHTVTSGSSMLAFKYEQEKLVPVAKEEARVYSFLPTEELTGFPFIVQGNFSTDPSRRRLIMDEKTHCAIAALAQLVLETLNDLIAKGVDEYAQVISPFADPRMNGLRRRDFSVTFLEAIQKLGDTTFTTTLLRPAWLNGKDFSKILASTETPFLAPKHETAEMVSLLKFLGAKEAKIEDLPENESVQKISAIGKVEVSTNLVNRMNAGQPLPKNAIGMKIWDTEEGTKSIAELTVKAVPLKASFLENLQEKNVVRRDLHRVLEKAGGKRMAQVVVPEAVKIEEPAPPPEPPKGFKRLVSSAAGSSEVVRINSKRWRNAELLVMDIILAQGCKVTDVSKQNVGYDLEVREEDGSRYGIEIKSIDYPGQPFSMTSNETNVAHELGDAFVLALVIAKADRAEIQFIENPLANLSFERKCRQWVMECDRYFFDPMVIPLKGD
jgi:hypothetical protein